MYLMKFTKSEERDDEKFLQRMKDINTHMQEFHLKLHRISKMKFRLR